MPAPEVVSALEVRFNATPYPLGVAVPATALKEVLRTLKEQYGYRHYVLASATDRGETLEVLHGVRHPGNGDVIFVKVEVPAEDPRVPSVVDLYSGADWYEREVYDLFGVIFEGHPNLKRILLPEEYDRGHPLRKSFKAGTPYEPGFRFEEQVP